MVGLPLSQVFLFLFGLELTANLGSIFKTFGNEKMAFIYLKVVISSRAFVHNAATEALDHRLTDY